MAPYKGSRKRLIRTSLVRWTPREDRVEEGWVGLSVLPCRVWERPEEGAVESEPFASTAEAPGFTERPNRKGKGSREAVLFILFRSGWEFVS